MVRSLGAVGTASGETRVPPYDPGTRRDPASRATLRLTAAGIGVRTAVELTLSAAGELASMPRTVAVAADFITEEDPS